MQPEYWTKATRHLSRQCPTMRELIKRYEGESLRSRGNAFETLLRAVVGQQISVKAADAVWKRLAEAVDPLTPSVLLDKGEEELRACGLSRSKVVYSRNLAEFFIERGIDESARSKLSRHPREGGDPALKKGPVRAKADSAPDRGFSHRDSRLRGNDGTANGGYWDQFSDDEIIAQLTSIKGIGTWTAEMFLIFHLMRPDVFPIKDLGVLKAINLHYVKPAKLKDKKWLKNEEYHKIANEWAPYRTVATWYLWRALDPVPVEY